MRHLILLVTTLIFAACSSVTVTPYKYLPPYEGQVTLYHTPPEIYEIVALVEVSGSSTLGDLISMAKVKAAQRGADGLLITKDDIGRFETGQYLAKGYAIQTHLTGQYQSQ